MWLATGFLRLLVPLSAILGQAPFNEAPRGKPYQQILMP